MSKTTPIYALPYPEETDSADVPRDVQALAQRLEVVLPNVGFPTGAGADWYAAAAPAGFLLCDGSAVSRTAYPALFGVLGVVWGGGDGITTFNLPDTRGRVIVGVAPGGHADVAALGGNDGTPLPSRRPRHGHTNGLTLPNHAHFQQVANVGGGGARGIESRTDTSNTMNDSFGTGNPSTLPAIPGAIGVAGSVDAPSYVVAAKVVKT